MWLAYHMNHMTDLTKLRYTNIVRGYRILHGYGAYMAAGIPDMTHTWGTVLFHSIRHVTVTTDFFDEIFRRVTHHSGFSWSEIFPI